MPEFILLLLALLACLMVDAKDKSKQKKREQERQRIQRENRQQRDERLAREAQENYWSRQGNRTPRPTIDPAEHNSRFLSEQKRRNEEYTKKLIEQTEADIKASEKFFLED